MQTASTIDNSTISITKAIYEYIMKGWQCMCIIRGWLCWFWVEELVNLLNEFHQRICRLEFAKYDMEFEVRKKDFEVQIQYPPHRHSYFFYSQTDFFIIYFITLSLSLSLSLSLLSPVSLSLNCFWPIWHKLTSSTHVLSFSFFLRWFNFVFIFFFSQIEFFFYQSSQPSNAVKLVIFQLMLNSMSLHWQF